MRLASIVFCQCCKDFYFISNVRFGYYSFSNLLLGYNKNIKHFFSGSVFVNSNFDTVIGCENSLEEYNNIKSVKMVIVHVYKPYIKITTKDWFQKLIFNFSIYSSPSFKMNEKEFVNKNKKQHFLRITRRKNNFLLLKL